MVKEQERDREKTKNAESEKDENGDGSRSIKGRSTPGTINKKKMRVQDAKRQ